MTAELEQWARAVKMTGPEWIEPPDSTVAGWYWSVDALQFSTSAKGQGLWVFAQGDWRCVIPSRELDLSRLSTAKRRLTAIAATRAFLASDTAAQVLGDGWV